VAFFVARLFARNWPYGTPWDMTDFKLDAILGYVVCFVVLSGVALIQLFTGHRRSAFLNLCLAALTALLCLPLFNFVRA
jgi:hypothetical protein